MYKSVYLIAALLALSGCAKPMSYEDVQKAKKYCESNGLSLQLRNALFSNTFTEINFVRCIDGAGRTYPIPDSVYK